MTSGFRTTTGNARALAVAVALALSVTLPGPAPTRAAPEAGSGTLQIISYVCPDDGSAPAEAVLYVVGDTSGPPDVAGCEHAADVAFWIEGGAISDQFVTSEDGTVQSSVAVGVYTVTHLESGQAIDVTVEEASTIHVIAFQYAPTEESGDLEVTALLCPTEEQTGRTDLFVFGPVQMASSTADSDGCQVDEGREVVLSGEASFYTDANGTLVVQLAAGTYSVTVGEETVDVDVLSGSSTTVVAITYVPSSEPPTETTVEATAGDTVSLGEVATTQVPVITSVTTPNAGTVRIATTLDSPPSPSGYALLGSTFDINAPAASVEDPLIMRFTLDASVLEGVDAETLTVLRNGTPIGDCDAAAGPAALPDPCESARALDATSGDLTIEIRTSQASHWQFATLNSTPVIGAISAAVDPVPIAAAVSASATFSDADALDVHTATWDWGDGKQTTGSVTQSSVTGAHTYALPGVYVVKLTVSDGANLATAAFEYVVVYDSNGGFVTGGGWIESPAGALEADPTATGKAHFGFEARYHKGARVPSGRAEFQFRAGGIDFRSTSCEWLVIAGAKGQFKGEGTLNGNSGYGFLLTAIDGHLSGDPKADRFRIKVWDKTTGNVVYDNQRGAADTATPETALAGGSIVIHKGK